MVTESSCKPTTDSFSILLTHFKVMLSFTAVKSLYLKRSIPFICVSSFCHYTCTFSCLVIVTVILTVSEESFKMNSCTIVFIEDDSWLSHYCYMYMYSKSDIVIAALYMYVLHVCVFLLCVAVLICGCLFIILYLL